MKKELEDVRTKVSHNDLFYHINDIGSTYGNPALANSFKGKEEDYRILIREGQYYIKKKYLRMYANKHKGIHQDTRDGIMTFIKWLKERKVEVSEQASADAPAEVVNEVEVVEPTEEAIPAEVDNINGMMTPFSYQGNKVSFIKTDNGMMINATEMAKPFGEDKSPKHWLKNLSSQRFIRGLLEVRKVTSGDLVKVQHGVGTWMHEDVALEFARWLSPEFAIWTNDHIKKLLTTGMTKMGDLDGDDLIAKALILAQSKLEQERERNKALEGLIETKNIIIDEKQNELDRFMALLGNADSISLRECYKKLLSRGLQGFSERAFKHKLYEQGFLLSDCKTATTDACRNRMLELHAYQFENPYSHNIMTKWVYWLTAKGYKAVFDVFYNYLDKQAALNL